MFCDLRKQNTKDAKVPLINFDWTGREGKVTSPVSISNTIEWPKGCRLILKQHDGDMLARYCGYTFDLSEANCILSQGI